jgi:hypothetical protein
MTDWIKAEVDRRLRRDAHREVTSIIELADEGYSSSVIASSVGLTEEFVREVLEQAEAVCGETENLRKPQIAAETEARP